MKRFFSLCELWCPQRKSESLMNICLGTLFFYQIDKIDSHYQTHGVFKYYFLAMNNLKIEDSHEYYDIIQIMISFK